MVSRRREPRGIVVAWLIRRIVNTRVVERNVVVGTPPWLITISPFGVSADSTATRWGQPVGVETFTETRAWPKVSFSRRVGATVRMTSPSPSILLLPRKRRRRTRRAGATLPWYVLARQGSGAS